MEGKSDLVPPVRTRDPESVVSLGTAKKLKSSRYPQSRASSGWVESSEYVGIVGLRFQQVWSAAAPSATELLAAIPRSVIVGGERFALTTVASDQLWSASFVGARRWRKSRAAFVAEAANLSDALASLWLQLQQAGLLTECES